MPVRVGNQSEPIPGYKLIERLGRGGFGEVWKAEAPGGLLKAIKFVYGEIEGVAGEGIAADQELKALNRVKSVRHPYLLSLERVDIIDGQLIIVMELADRSLMDRFKECHAQGLPGIPREEMLGYMAESAEALDLMNMDFQLQHLDIKPQNLFLVRNHVKVADFGLCKDLQDFKASVTGGVTPLYAAPETFEGWVSRFCDQYSLAIVYQELLTGQRPFDGTNARQLLMQHVQMPPDLTPLPEGDRAIIGRALSKKPQDRFPNCMDMVQALRAAGASEAVHRVSELDDSAPPSTHHQRADNTPDNGGYRGNSSQAITKNIVSSPQRPARVEIKKTRMSFHGIAVTPKPTGLPAAGAQLLEADTSQRPINLSAPVEFQGEGTLFPALVIGLGQAGQEVLRNLRQALCDRYGTMEHLPHLRLLYLDTDPDAVQAAIRGGTPNSLDAGEALLARLNRPSYYLKPRDMHTEGGKPLIATWLDPQMLYRIPRSQTTSGVRALGRLALVDNYTEVNARILEDLRACTEAEALAVADRHTRLGLRINRPRVYVVAGLAGGTGSGMFIDVAYAARHQLRRLGYQQIDLVGLFFVPPVRTNPGKPMPLGNAYAALRELYHFNSPGVSYSARFAAKQAPLTDADAPFGRCVLLPAEAEDDTPRNLAGDAAGFLFRDLMSPLGRAADNRRLTLRKDTIDLKPGLKVPPVLHTFGMYRLTWPRRSLVERGSRRIAVRLVQHWVSKDATAVRAEVDKWVKDQWAKRQLQADHLIACLRAGAEGVLDAEPEEAFDALVAPVADRQAWRANPDPALGLKVLAAAERLVGRPDGVASAEPPQLKEGLEKAAQTLLANCEQKVVEMAVHLVEQPKFRFAGADEAIRQMEALLRATIEQQDLLAKEFATKATDSFNRINSTLEATRTALASKRKLPPGIEDLPNLLALYPNFRFKCMLLQHVLTVYRSLLGNCPEFLREFSYCRARLGEVLKTFDQPPPPSAASANLGAVRQLLPGGSHNLDEAVTRLVDGVNRDELLVIDKKVQSVIQRQLKAMVHICTAPAASIVREVEYMLVQELEAYTANRLGSTNILDTFFEQFPRDEGATTQIANHFEDAMPILDARGLATKQHAALLLVPADPAAEHFRELAQNALPEGAELVTAASGDDLVFYREVPGLALADLPQLGPEAKAAYDRMAATGHFTAHNRIDITDWRPVTAH